MKVTTLTQFENGIERVAEKITQCETALAGKLDSTGKAETAGTADNAISDGEGNIIANTYLKKSDNVSVDLTEYQTAAQADAKYLGKNDTAANAEKATKDGQNRNIADTYLEKSVWKEFGVSSADKAGTEGYVPAPPATSDTKILTNFGWKDPQNTQIAISTVPSQNGSVTYDGTAKTPTWLNYDPLKLQISGDYENKTNAGTYPVGFKPLGIYTWSNGTQDIQYATWAIGKAAGSLSLSAESGSINIDATKTFTVNRAGDGAITATSSNSNVASVSVSGNTVTITGKATGSATITVQVAEGTNHFAPSNKTYAVTVTKIPLSLSASISSAVTYNTTGTITLNGNAGGGAVTATSANSSCVTVSNTTTSTVTVKCANYSAAATSITINVAETTKYASGTCTCNVTTAKAASSITLSKTAGTVTYGQSDTFTVKTNLSGGTLSVTSADTNYARSSISGSTVTVSCASYRNGNTVITVKSAATTNYNEATATYTLTPAKANISPTASISGAVTYNTDGTISISGNLGGGAVTATSANSNCISIVSTSTNTVTVKCVKCSTNAVTVTINIAATTNYNAGSCTCNVTTAKAQNGFVAWYRQTETAVIGGTVSWVVNSRYENATLSSSSSNDNIVTTSIIYDEEIQVAITGKAKGSATITVTCAETENYASATNSFTAVCYGFNILDNPDTNTISKFGTAAANGLLYKYIAPGYYFDITIPNALTLDSGYSIPANSSWRCVCIGGMNITQHYVNKSCYTAHFAICRNTNNEDAAFGYKCMNSTETNAGGWKDSEMRAWLNDTFYNALPADLKTIINNGMPVDKYTDNVGGTGAGIASNITLTQDRIWLLAEYEVNGIDGHTRFANTFEADKQTQYEYFANGNKINIGTWFRSPVKNTSSPDYDKRFCFSGHSTAEANLAREFIPCFGLNY